MDRLTFEPHDLYFKISLEEACLPAPTPCPYRSAVFTHAISKLSPAAESMVQLLINGQMDNKTAAEKYLVRQGISWGVVLKAEEEIIKMLRGIEG